MNKFLILISIICIVVYLNLSGSLDSIDKPNVILIMADDLNTKVGYFNEKIRAQTPHIDKLARSSINFVDAHAPATVCNPSRLSILTSKLPGTTGVYDLFPGEAAQIAIKTNNLKTIMDTFRENGYKTMGTGKIFHWGNDSTKFFDEFYQTTSTEDTLDNRAEPNWRYWDKDENDLSDSRKTKWAVDLLQKNQQQPFFMMIGYESPHLPWIVPKKYFDLYSVDKISQEIGDPCKDILDIDGKISIRYHKNIYKLIGMLEDRTLAQALQAYLASTSYLDTQVGALLAALDKSNYARNTVVIFTSDQGFQLGEKCTIQKGTLWRESSQVPFLIRIPGMKGKVCKKTVGLIDLFPTLVELCKLKPVSNLEGHSLVALIKNPHKAWNYPVISTQGMFNHALRTNEWCYISYSNGSDELYNRQKDPREQINLSKRIEFIKLKENLQKSLPIINSEPIKSDSIQ